MRLLVTRPEPDATAQAKLLAERGHEAVCSPLFEVEFLVSKPLPNEGLQAVIVTSRNALRAMQHIEGFERLLGLPLFAVGSATARLAAKTGFEKIHAGEGTAELLAPLIAINCNPENGPLLHPAGETLARNLKGALEEKGFTVLQPVVYRSKAVARLPHSAIAALKEGKLDGVILMSPETARLYVELIGVSGLEHTAGKLTYFCLSEAVARPLEGLPGVSVRVADKPAQDDILALIAPEAAN